MEYFIKRPASSLAGPELFNVTGDQGIVFIENHSTIFSRRATNSIGPFALMDYFIERPASSLVIMKLFNVIEDPGMVEFVSPIHRKSRF